jgi:tetratricopeptide (TPR) repeat protein
MQTDENIRQNWTFPGLLLFVFSLVIYIILIWSLSKPAFGWLALGRADEKGLLSAVRFDKENATHYSMLAGYFHKNLTDPDIDKAIKYYRKSLSLNPLQAGSWINLSRAYMINGQNAEAEYAIERAVALSPNNPELMWEAGTFWLIGNRTDKAVSALRKYILLSPDKQNAVYDLSWKLNLDNNYILANLVPGSYAYQSRYLHYLIRTKRVNESQEVWNILDINRLKKNEFISYVNFLINNSLYEKAEKVWHEITGDTDRLNSTGTYSLIWNPGFENEMLNGGFDWVIREAQGADVFLDDLIQMNGNYSLGITFDGDHNPDITIAQQVVRVNPGTKYTLRSFIKTDALTTKNGIIIVVQSHNCKGLYKKSEALTGTNFWKKNTLDFKTPDECEAVMVKIRRERSDKFDNKIKGTAWIDDITLKHQTDLLKSTFKKRSG